MHLSAHIQSVFEQNSRKSGQNVTVGAAAMIGKLVMGSAIGLCVGYGFVELGLETGLILFDFPGVPLLYESMGMFAAAGGVLGLATWLIDK
ncbi:hypothetical protein [Aestuariivita boseongensis]|uniref:hypothetical protein n=1 Tax=Aestuariivita boseongensis TaxID=1470562 RepID=UPI00068105D1|nr:hypothetical protein [Aestuariivita boseongensis]